MARIDWGLVALAFAGVVQIRVWLLEQKVSRVELAVIRTLGALANAAALSTELHMGRRAKLGLELARETVKISREMRGAKRG